MNELKSAIVRHWLYNEYQSALATKPTKATIKGFVVPPYVQGVTKVSFKPQKTSLFPRQKEQDETNRPSSEKVYKINRSQCDFVYYDQTERSLKARVSGRKKIFLIFDHNSKRARVPCRLCPRMSSSHGFWKRWRRRTWDKLPSAAFSRSFNVCKKNLTLSWERPDGHLIFKRLART